MFMRPISRNQESNGAEITTYKTRDQKIDAVVARSLLLFSFSGLMVFKAVAPILKNNEQKVLLAGSIVLVVYLMHLNIRVLAAMKR